jgi:metal-responsive CopG/Arc/MetJ family transcriptional regulator
MKHSEPSNVVRANFRFTPNGVPIDDLTEKTLRAIDQLAAEEGLSRDEFISKALSQILAEFEIGDFLVEQIKRELRKAGHLLPEQKVALENWERRICQIQKDYGTLFAIYARPR